MDPSPKLANLGQIASGVAPGVARCLFADDVADSIHRLLAESETEPALRLLCCPLAPSGGMDSLLAQGIEGLAELAGVLWPHWYGTYRQDATAPTAGPMSHPRTDGIERQAATDPRIHLAWLRAAAGCCRAGRSPVLDQFPRAVQAAQLTLALGPEDLLLLLVCVDSDIAAAPLLTLARAAEWLAGSARVRVLLLLDAAHHGRIELDPIAYGALQLRGSAQVDETRRASLLERGWIWPVVGRPHPQSPGEQALAAALARDTELRDLFEFNVWIETAKGSRFLVDLLWRAGRLVIEVDGLRFHRHARRYRSDRQRDYELTVSGYTQLLLVHDEVIENLAGAVGKIRDVVRFQTNHPRSRLETLL